MLIRSFTCFSLLSERAKSPFFDWREKGRWRGGKEREREEGEREEVKEEERNRNRSVEEGGVRGEAHTHTHTHTVKKREGITYIHNLTIVHMNRCTCVYMHLFFLISVSSSGASGSNR